MNVELVTGHDVTSLPDTARVTGYGPGIHCAENRLGLWRVFEVDGDGSRINDEIMIKCDPETGRYHIRVAGGPNTWSRSFPDGDTAKQRARFLLKAVIEANRGLLTFQDMLQTWHELMFN